VGWENRDVPDINVGDIVVIIRAPDGALQGKGEAK